MERRRIHPLVIDTVMAVGFLVLGLISRVEITSSGLASVYSREADTLNTFLVAMQALPLALRRRYPVAVLATVSAAFGVDRVLDYPNTLASAGIVLAIHAVGSELPRARSLRLGGAFVLGVTAFTGFGAATLQSVGIDDVVFMAIATGAPLLLGREVYERRRRLEELTERAEQAERDREERARQAVAEERARIARELHDVVAHQMAVMTLQAEGASRLAGEADPRVRDALHTIRDAGHDALEEMRRMVGLLRTGPEEERPLVPQPGLDRLSELLEQMREAGLDVTLEVRGDAVALPSGVDLNAFRIVQESLTNTLKHGGPNTRAAVTVSYVDDRVDIEVTDDGRGAAADPGENGGHGLVGMRERVALLHGEFAAGPRPGGGFAVRASIPVHA